MKKLLLFIFILLGTSIYIYSQEKSINTQACFICSQAGQYVIFSLPDTLEKRQRAKQEFNCLVIGTSTGCSTTNILL